MSPTSPGSLLSVTLGHGGILSAQIASLRATSVISHGVAAVSDLREILDVHSHQQNASPDSQHAGSSGASFATVDCHGNHPSDYRTLNQQI
jgi:hypothetical protein